MDYQVVAESIVHQDRRLLIGREGNGYIQLDSSSLPIAVSDRDFARLRMMGHYRPVVLQWNFEHSGVAAQVAD